MMIMQFTQLQQLEVEEEKMKKWKWIHFVVKRHPGKQKNHPKLLYYINEAVCALTMVTVNDQSRSLFHFASKVPSSSSSPALDAVPFQFLERQSFSFPLTKLFLLITEIGSSSWDNGILIRQSTVHHIDTGKEVKVSLGDFTVLPQEVIWSTRAGGTLASFCGINFINFSTSIHSLLRKKEM